MRFPHSLVPVLALILLGILSTSPALAQEINEQAESAILSTADVEAAVVGHERAADRTRAELETFLKSDAVETVAHEGGVDLNRVASAVGTMSDTQVHAIAPLLERAEAALQRGGSITISVYAIIIILLLLILLT